MEKESRQLKDLNWIEIATVFADLMWVHLSTAWEGGFNSCETGFRWTLNNIAYASGPARSCDTLEESCKHLVKHIFRYGSTGPYSEKLNFPKIEFDSPAELQMKLEIAGIDIEFMLTHRSC